MNHRTHPVVVMIVDDEPENLNLLDDILRLEGWEVRAFSRGSLALAAAQETPPDLVLLDVRMPEMDGYETCRRFKANPKLRPIPVLFLSALSDSADKLRAFEAGGVDYVTKPFSEKEVLARVRTQLQLYRHQTVLERLIQQDVQDLAEAHWRLRIWDSAKTDWINMLAHELRPPLVGILGITDLLFLDLPPEAPYHALRTDYEESRRRIEKLIDDACTLAQIDVATEQFALLHMCAAHAIRAAVHAYTQRQPAVAAALALHIPPEIMVRGDPELLPRALTDLLLTAACCVPDGDGVRITAESDPQAIRIAITTEGQGLSDQALALFFEVGGQRTLFKGGGDFGLGAVLARRIIELLKGSVTVQNGQKSGLRIDVTLPVEQGRERRG